ncbi:MAG: oxygen-dependent coproporphyrinogen oxidase [Planctomycetes bacterium]|nr:oxygen-dependent coproporphyrinogen oxidase [Planctomycetota bacterium]
MDDIRARFVAIVERTQEEITAAAESLEDGRRFREDRWQREGGGGGVTRVLQDGTVFEKAGANVSIVHGRLSEEAARSLGGDPALANRALDFWATGVSTVLHPHNPHAPTAHANFRYFERRDGEDVVAWWFGGGADLTPCYLVESDIVHFHRTLEAACGEHRCADYPRFKEWCDRYFTVAHRGESRGVGGIFFDHLTSEDPSEILAFVDAAAAAFVPAYFPIVERRCGEPYDERQREWQQLRRGRYVEFNLVYDRGTVFGLRTAGRIESVLMSLPLTARWEYDHQPAIGTPEAQLLEVLRTPRDWL